MRKYKVVEYGAFKYAIMYKLKWYKSWNFYVATPGPFTKSGIRTFNNPEEANQFIKDRVNMNESNQS